MILFPPIFMLVLLACVPSHESEEKAWYSQLPDEHLRGVPKILVDNEKYFRAFKLFLFSLYGRSGETKSTIEEGIRRQKVQEVVDDSVPFPCPLNNSRSSQRPTSVHELRPGDIDVVGAMGDSLTAGNGAFALNSWVTTVENRGVSATIGGQGDWKHYLTLPNILKEFNSNLIGYSTGDSISADPKAGFNMAEAGAMTQDLPHMTKVLVKKIKKHPKVHLQDDWKLVTVIIGANNFCADLCYLKNSTTSADVHKRCLTKSFQYLRDNMPRTIVNLVHSIDIKSIVELKEVPSECRYVHKLNCPCLFTQQHKPRLKEYFQTVDRWRKVEEEIARDPQFRETNTFAVNLITFTKHLTPPMKYNVRTGKWNEDYTLFAADCFHLSQKGMRRSAIALWNSMLTPDGSRITDWKDAGETFKCPSENSPFIYTWKNSH